MDVKTILWPTDLSDNSLQAGKHVVSLAEKYQAEVILLYVSVDLCAFFPAYGNYPSIEHLNNFRDWEIEKARKRLEKICDEELKGCPYLRLKLVIGDPSTQILDMAEKENADLIVLTSIGHGQDGKKNDGLGHVADTVVRSSPIPVHMINPLNGQK